MGLTALLVVAAGAAFKWGWFGRKDRTSTAEPEIGLARAERLPFAIDDVVVRAGDEAWLAGGLAMREGGEPFGVVYIAPERRSHRAIVVFASPREEVLWLEPIAAPFSGEPPSTLDVEGTIYERTSRRPVAIERRGEHAPDVGARATFAEFRGPGRAALCTLTTSGGPLAWRGERAALAELERMPGR